MRSERKARDYAYRWPMPLFHRTRTDGRRGTHCECFVERARAHSALFVIGRRGDGNANVPSPSPAVSSIKTNNVHVRCECDINAPPLRRRRPVSSVTAARKLRSTTSRGTYFNIALHASIEFYATRSSAIAEGLRDASCQLKSCQLLRNSAETTRTTSPEQIEVMKLEGYSGPMCNKHVHSTVTRSSRFHCRVVYITCIPTTCCGEILSGRISRRSLASEN